MVARDQVGQVSHETPGQSNASRSFIEQAGLVFRIPTKGTGDERLLCLGDDEDDLPLEVVAVELEGGDLYVIHAMPMRNKYRDQYEEAKRWAE